MNTPTTTEARTAESLLQQPDPIVVGKHSYSIYPPSTATLIEVSRLISLMHLHNPHKEEGSVLSFVIRNAKDYQPLSQILATLILGVRPPARSLSDLWEQYRYRRAYRRLQSQILHRLSPEELSRLLTRLLERIGVADFFVVTTFLSEMNIAGATREVATKTPTEATALGQS